MTLIAAHRILMWTFTAFAVLFGVTMLRRHLAGGDGALLAVAIVSWIVAAGAAVYLLKAPHLRRK